jgi:uncharacterized membrane protein
VTFPIPPDLPGAPPARPRYLRPGWLVVAVLLVAAVAAAGVRVWRGRGAAGAARLAEAPSGVTSPPLTDTLARAPRGVRVKVQVVNATRVRGLARRATHALRDRGFDVVEVSTTAEQRDSTLVLDRSGHPDWAGRAARAMGGARVDARPDTSRYLDLTVLVGRTWRPPAEALDP